MSYTNAATVQVIADLVNVDPKVKGELYSAYLEKASVGHNAFERFTSVVNPNTNVAGGIRSIFAKKTDLAAGGSDSVNFNVIGPPGGPGVQGNEELTGHTSTPLLATYPVRVGWQRDGFELTRDVVEFLSAGRSLVQTTMDLLAAKMGLLKQNHQMMRLIKSAVAGVNVFRVDNRSTTDALKSTDTLSLSAVLAARARLRTLGAQPLFHKVSDTGSPIDNYLCFATDTAMLGIRNDSDFQTAVSNGDTRGPENGNFSGELVKWQGMPWYEFPVVDQPWDDYLGCPLLAKARLGVAFGASSAVGACKLIVNPSNTSSRYFQWFDGYDFKFTQDQTAAPDATKHYAWIINPNGSVGFVSYVGSANNGNQITITEILSKNGAGTSTLGKTTVGELVIDTDANPDSWTGGNSTLEVTGPNGAWVYTDEFAADAIILQANAKGTPYSRSFIFGSMASCFASGRIAMNQIEQTRDFGFTIGRGFEMIFGTGVTLNPRKKPAGYLLVEHAVEHEGYPVPQMA